MTSVRRSPFGSTGARVALVGLSVLLVAIVARQLFALRYRPEPVRAANAAGNATCISCHRDKASFEETAHHLTSRLPSRRNILASFSPGQNVLWTSNPQLHFRMDSVARGFYETAVMGSASDTIVYGERIAFVTGSRKGQSYLSWKGDELLQLPISYWTGLGWANSPAYADGRPNFGRPIPSRCLECHATSFERAADSAGVSRVNRYKRSGIMLGISCETCHAAGQEHVLRERSPLRQGIPTAIVNPARLSRERQLDGCALCHGGTAPLESAAFSHVPGQPLRKRFDLYSSVDTTRIDVHGNQVSLLERSTCFRQSQMTCTTCHDVHREQRDVVALSGKCATCHTMRSCGLYPRYGVKLAGQCVNCHMPRLTSGLVISNYRGRQEHIQVRSHWIKSYPQFRSLEALPLDSSVTDTVRLPHHAIRSTQ